MGKQQQHLGVTLVQGVTTTEAVWWKMGHLASQFRRTMELVVSLEVNEFQGNRNIQMEIHDATCIGS